VQWHRSEIADCLAVKTFLRMMVVAVSEHWSIPGIEISALFEKSLDLLQTS
jgi:hypothetical protein